MLRATASVEFLNFQDLIEKSDFNKYFIGRYQSLNLPEKLAGKENMCDPSENIRSLADVLVLPKTSDKFENYCFKKTD